MISLDAAGALLWPSQHADGWQRGFDDAKRGQPKRNPAGETGKQYRRGYAAGQRAKGLGL